MKPRVIAMYLPQYHPIPENDKWWGKGFTEWTNVGKAKPLFRGHDQPKVPADLGYYDLRLPIVREEQAELAKEAGIEGFMYWHYWFGNGKELLEMPFKEVVRTGKPDYPFCLGWANESWQAKEWNSDKSATVKKTLIAQTYPGKEDNKNHFQAYEQAFRDKRYIRVDGKPLFLIYRPKSFKGLIEFMNQWNNLIKQTGIAEKFYFVGMAWNSDRVDDIKNMGFDAVTVSPLSRMYDARTNIPLLIRAFRKAYRVLFRFPNVVRFDIFAKSLWNDYIDMREDVIPTLMPNWDHSPRSKNNSTILTHATPKAFYDLCFKEFTGVSKKKNQIVFLKSWNEWGEGNYMEPDLKYGKGYIKALKDAIDNIYRN